MTTVVGEGYAVEENNLVSFRARATITTNGTGAGGILLTLPFNAKNGTIPSYFTGVVVGTGKSVIARTSSATQVFIQLYDGTYPGANATVIEISGQYERA